MQLQRRQYVEVRGTSYDFWYYCNGSEGKIVVGYDLNPATGIACSGFQLIDDCLIIGPSRSPIRTNSNYRESGIADAMLRMIIEFAAEEHDFSEVSAETQHDNLAAIGLFQKNGFEMQEEKEGLVNLIKKIQ